LKIFAVFSKRKKRRGMIEATKRGTSKSLLPTKSTRKKKNGGETKG